MRSLRSPREKQHNKILNETRKSINLNDYKIKLPGNTIGIIYNELIADKNSFPLVLTVLSTMGPPIIIRIGFILQNGDVLLDDGIGVDGAYWKSSDRTLYHNGTIQYNQIDLIDEGKMIFGTVSNDGEINPLPNVKGKRVSLHLLKSIDIRSKSSVKRNLSQTDPRLHPWFEDLKDSFESILSSVHRKIMSKRSTRELNLYPKFLLKIKLLLSFTKLMGEFVEDKVELDKSFLTMACSLMGIEEMEIMIRQNTLYPIKMDKLKCLQFETIREICNF